MSDNVALTDAEWRAFQSIPDQGYSHRAWVDSKIKARLEAAKAEPGTIDREELAEGLAKYGPEWWGTDDVQHMVSNIVEDTSRDAGSVAHEMWTMGAWLKHPKCRNEPGRGNDGDYSNECEACQAHLLVVADVLIGTQSALAAQPGTGTVEDGEIPPVAESAASCLM